ncbi:transcription factor GRAS [Artemisia annua]|uniref:Transcription factor GRAS n=1 Tax=Artemisia annua TaxID=35608 RepID=A0A2U1MEJ8_ARTAN|nr:transcription factor GRAS [Artemisia annua]
MRAGFEAVQGSLELIQPQEQWDYNNTLGAYVGTSTTTSSVNGFSDYSSKPHVNLERPNELSEWVEHVTKTLIEDLPESESNHEEVQTDATMPTYDEVSPHMGETRPQKMARGNGPDDAQFGDPSNKGLSLISTLFECAVAISVDNLGEAHRMVLELTQMASPYASSCGERVVAYFAKSMASRVVNSWLGFCSPLTNHKLIHGAFQVFNNISPFVKFAHFTSNQAILEAFQRRDRVHIVDLDIMQGLQWPALFHILATRMEGPPHVRMTGMGTSMELLMETGKQLSNFAKRLGMSFEFHPVAKKFGDITDLSMLQIRRGDALAIHWLQHSLYDATGTDWKTMRLLQELNPRIITLVEQDISHGGSFLDRFVGSLHYYSAIFDSLGAFLPNDDNNRHRVEHSLIHREINNVLAVGGPGRSGEDKFKVWRHELGRNGFLQVPMSSNSLAQAQLILNMFPPTHGYSLVQVDGTLRLGWKETALYTASAWTCHVSR